MLLFAALVLAAAGTTLMVWRYLATRGALLDVIVDLREDSPAFRKWDAVDLTAENRRMLYMPDGIAHGYITLMDGTEAYYHASSPWVREAESGVRWDDPAFAIEWPATCRGPQRQLGLATDRIRRGHS